MGENMSQNKEQKPSGAGRSRAKANTQNRRSTASGSSSRSGSTRTSSAGRRSSGRKSSSGVNYGYTAKRRSSKRRGRSSFGKLAVGGVLLILAITCIVFLMKGMKDKPENIETETETTTEPETELAKSVMVDGIDITGMSREDAKQAILKNYPWAMKVQYQEETYEVTDLMAEKVDALLQEIYTGEPKESYTLNTDGLEDAARAEAANAAAKWDKKAKNGSISSYDAATDKFLFTGAEQGRAVDQEKLASDITEALKRKEFDAVIEASVKTVDPEFSEATAREKYKTIGSFSTKTTSNNKRNTNIKLAANAINGTVLQPGQEFSFNDTVGQRTEAKGYQGAAAYNNGEVVEEIGGGVCQVSSTLYNAVLKAGLKSTVRRSHTYEPSYVTPGTDATVSWGGPDYKFVNNSSAAIGIKASYYNQEVSISIYGIPVLEEGVKYSLKSTKIKDMDPPEPQYEEDPTLEPGVEKTKSSGSVGSYWETKLVITKNGEVVSEKVDHSTTYKGHRPVILRNTSGTVAATQPSEGEIEPSTPASEGAADGFHNTDGAASTTSASGTSQAPSGSTAAEPSKSEAADKPGSTSGKPENVSPTAAGEGPGNHGEAPTTAAPKPAETVAAPGAGSQAPGGGPADSVPTIAPIPSQP